MLILAHSDENGIIPIEESFYHLVTGKMDFKGGATFSDNGGW